MFYLARFALVLIVIAASLAEAPPVLAQECKPKYGWNPFAWSTQEAGAKAACDIRRMLDELDSLSDAEILARVEAAKAQGGGDARRIPVPGITPAAAAPVAQPSPPARSLDEPTR